MGVPYHPNPKHTPVETAFREIREFFRIWDYVERVEFIGGESLLHPNILDIIREVMNYSNQFDRIRITTNATIVPGDELLGYVRNCGKYADFILSDYGPYSINLNRIVEKLTKYDIPYRIDQYHGNDQYFGGWVSFGNYERIDYTDDEADQIFRNCVAAKNHYTCVNDGKAFSCCYAMSLYLVKNLLWDDGSYIDLFDDSLSLEQKRKIAADFNKSIITPCHYCRGLETENSERYPGPPEQLPRIKGLGGNNEH
jgi:hypothetical protein